MIKEMQEKLEKSLDKIQEMFDSYFLVGVSTQISHLIAQLSDLRSNFKAQISNSMPQN